MSDFAPWLRDVVRRRAFAVELLAPVASPVSIDAAKQAVEDSEVTALR